MRLQTGMTIHEHKTEGGHSLLYTSQLLKLCVVRNERYEGEERQRQSLV